VRSFGVRLSADTPFAGLEGDARLQLFEDGSSFYLSVGVGLRPFSNNPHEFLTWFALRVKATRSFIPVILEGLEHAAEKRLNNYDLTIGAGLEAVVEFFLTIDLYLPPTRSVLRIGHGRCYCPMQTLQPARLE
jgi:hypothetical protein